VITAPEAREYFLRCAVDTHTGRDILRRLGYSAVIPDPTGGEDASTITIATRVAAEFSRRYLGVAR